VTTEGEHVRNKNAFEGLDAFVAARGEALLATAALLAGDRAAGEDLLQAALERLMRNWRRIDGDPEGYLRRTLYHLAIDRWRRLRRRPEVLASTDLIGQPDGTDILHLRFALVHALALLPPRQRAVLVLRYWEQLSEAEAAEILGCSVGTVKSSASRGLARLREITADWSADDAPTDAPTPNGAS
jgi:RNA polymerase sigma-70 factor (sigma-E family)